MSRADTTGAPTAHPRELSEKGTHSQKPSSLGHLKKGKEELKMPTHSEDRKASVRNPEGV